MAYAPSLARCERFLRPVLVKTLPPKFITKIYSKGRYHFLRTLCAEHPSPVEPPAHLARTLWGINFRSPLFNAAGLFKDGAGFDGAFALGAGAFLSGTSTANPRTGNAKAGIQLPFAPYPTSGAASNWLGLPGPGDKAIAALLKALPRKLGFPIGASIMGAPDIKDPSERLQRLIEGLWAYHAADVDFIELNESCPNTGERLAGIKELEERIERIAAEFLAKRRTNRRLPVLVKFSPDLDVALIPALLALLIKAGVDGVTFGNTSTDYAGLRPAIAEDEHALFDFFTKNFGGGISGQPLKAKVLPLIKAAASYLSENRPEQEFHLIWCGGIETHADLALALKSGASLAQWYTGFFEQYSRVGNKAYQIVW
jgi:dihydroorotate dehydrogenase